MNVNGHPSNFDRTQKPTTFRELADYLRKDFQKKPEPYVALGAVVLGSMFVGYKLKRVPTKAEVLNEWLAEMAAQGVNVYGLTNDQKKLWETVWNYTTTLSTRPGYNLSRAVAEIVDEYRWLAECGYV